MQGDILSDESAQSKAKQELSVLIFVPTYLKDVSVYERAFPNAKRIYTALYKHTNYVDYVPNLMATSTEIIPPLVANHLRLMRDYWSIKPSWPAWRWLDQEILLLKDSIHDFNDGCIEDYKKVIQKAAFCIRDFICNLLQHNHNSAVCIYGRGHWTMNAVAVAAEENGRTLYVIEHGILPETYIIDINASYSAAGSTFRKDWETYKSSLARNSVKSIEKFCTSSWQDYLACEPLIQENDRLQESKAEELCIFVGQCFFDYNLQSAPYDTPQEFIEYCFEKCSEKICGHQCKRRRENVPSGGANVYHLGH